MEVKQDENTIYTGELIFSDEKEKEDPKNEIWKVLYVAAFDDVKIHNKMTDVRQQKRHSRKDELPAMYAL